MRRTTHRHYQQVGVCLEPYCTEEAEVPHMEPNCVVPHCTEEGEHLGCWGGGGLACARCAPPPKSATGSLYGIVLQAGSTCIEPHCMTVVNGRTDLWES